jgi:hypothetical protein
MSARTYPYTAEDLRSIADDMDKILATVDPNGDVILGAGDWRLALTVDITDDGGNSIGQIRPSRDGWLGFYPKEVFES